TSDIEFLGDDIDEDDLFAANDENNYVESGFGVVGLKHRINIGDKSYLRSIVSGSYSSNEFNSNRFMDMDTPQERIIDYTEVDDSETRITFSTMYNSKLSNRSTLRTGILVEYFNIRSLLRDRTRQSDNINAGDPDLHTFRNVDENLAIILSYIDVQFFYTDNISFNDCVCNYIFTLIY